MAFLSTRQTQSPGEFDATNDRRRFRMLRSRDWVLALSLLLGCLGLVTARAQTAAIEYKVKAAFILNFARFVEWPENAFATPTSDLVIGVLGRDDPFGVTLDETIRGKTVDRRGLPPPKRSLELKDLSDCQVLFICRSEEKNIRRILDQLRGKPILTISEIPGFIEQGGIIEFKKRTDTVRFGINPAAARDAGLKISSKLLKLSD